MAMIIPQTDIKLCNVPLAIDQKNQMDFFSTTTQSAYFSGKALFSITDIDYVRKDNAIDVEKNIDELWAVNYCMYKNETLPNKWFYAFVAKMEYVNEEVTRLYLVTDVFQTWLFDFTINASFVEREHEDER